ncbi:hypothetical protein LJB84_00990 [Bacteroidales bacterium OttesenSCG-928-J19]|nr:hypothetical protein [Bacteroidales bacterium OttesenSCG-928-J19]
MRRFFTIICIASILTACQTKPLSQDDLSAKFNTDWCDCMQEQSSGKTPEEIVSQVSVNCVQKIMTQYTQDKELYDKIRVLVAEKGYDNSLSDHEKERLFGKELGKNLMANAIDNCVVYRQALMQFKDYYFEKAKQDMDSEEEVNEFIENIQKEIDEIDINQVKKPHLRKQISNYYVLLGMLYEYTDREQLAIKQYEKAIEFDPENTHAVGFQKLLIKYKNK